MVLERCAVIVAGLLIWQAVVRIFDVSPLLVPAPTAVFDQLIRATLNGAFFYNGLYTVGATVMGFLLGSFLGFMIGVLVTRFEIFNRLVYPYVVAF